MRTSFDPDGRTVLGTINNCAMGATPWGTYLTCEENFNNYFVNAAGDAPGIADPAERKAAMAVQKRYGISDKSNYRWHEHDERFDAAKNPNEFNRFGWIVEIDPFDSASQPVKHTALGRFKHEGAFVTLASDNRVVVYSGDVVSFEDPEAALSGARLYVGDGSTLKGSLVRRQPSGVLVGHTTVRAQLGWLDKFAVPRAIFSHFGKGPIEMGEDALGEALAALAAERAPRCEVAAARDGRKLDLELVGT